MNNRGKIAAVAGLLIIVVGAIGWFVATSPSAQDLTTKAKQSLKTGDYEQAEVLSRMALVKQPGFTAATRVNILASIRMQRYENARTRLKALPEGDEKTSIHLDAAGEFFQQGRLTDARHFLPADDNEKVGNANQTLQIKIASLVGDRKTLIALFQKADAVSLREQIISAYDRSEPTRQDLEIINRGAASSPPDALAITALAIHKERTGFRKEANELADKALRIDPSIMAAIEVRARSLVDTVADRKWELFILRLSSAALESPAIWEAFGDRCGVKEEYPEAIRCYYESIFRRSDSPSACTSLIDALQKTDNPKLIPNVRMIARNPSRFFADDEQRLAPLQPLGEYPLPQWVIKRQQQRRE